jgi:hypothetical protein
MKSQRRLLATVALPLAMIAACTRPQATEDSVAPLAPPDTLSEPTTTRPPPTTVPDVERTTISRVDPLTLEPLDGFEPIPMGDWTDWYWSDTSENGRWLAMSVYDELSGATELRLVDLESWEMVESWTIGQSGPLQVGDDGTTYLLGGSELLTFGPSPGGTRTAIDLPTTTFATWYTIDLYQGHVRMFGSRQLNEGVGGGAEILDVDLSSGEVTSIPLPGVELGEIAPVDIGEPGQVVVSLSPALMWDHPERALLVHAIEDVITEVDLGSGSVVEHRFGPNELDLSGEAVQPTGGVVAYVSSSRSAALSPDGATLYVATQFGDVEVTDQGWQTTSEPSGLLAIDMANWSVIDELDVPVSTIAMSPVGDRLLTTGYTDTQTFDTESQDYGEYEFGNTGFYLIDPDLDVIADIQPEDPTQTNYGPVSFAPYGLGYLMSWNQSPQINVIDLSNGAVLNSTGGTYDDVWLLGPIGVLGQVDQAG